MEVQKNDKLMAIFQVHSLVIGRIGSHLTSLIFGVEVFRLCVRCFKGPRQYSNRFVKSNN